MSKKVAKKTSSTRAKSPSSTRKTATTRKPRAGTSRASSPTRTTRTTRTTGPTSASSSTRTPRLPADVKRAIACAQDKQAQDLTVLDLRTASAFTDFFIICTGANSKQVQAIADSIEDGLKADGQKPALIEGYNRAEWVLLDYFTFIVHIFLPATRTFYGLERLWGGAEPIEVSAP